MQVQRLKNGVSARKAKKAPKDEALAAGLDADLEQLDPRLAPALHGHWRKHAVYMPGCACMGCD